MTTPDGGRREPTPGAPGGVAGGPRSATAATFQVNDSSLQSMRKTWQGLAKDVRDFAKAIDELKSRGKTLDDLHARLGKGVGTGTVSAASSGGTPVLAGGSTPFRGGDNHRIAGARGGAVAAAAEVGPPTGGGGRGGSPALAGGSNPFGTAVGTAVGAGIVGMGAYYARRTDDITDLDLLFNRQGQNTGGGYRESEKDASREFFFGGRGGQGTQGGIRGYQSAADLQAGVATLGTPGGALSNAGRRTLQNAGNMAALRPDAGLQGAAAASANLFDPTVSNRAMSMGIGPTLGPGGNRMSPSQVYSRILQTVFRGRKPTANQITEGLAPGAPLYMTLTQGLGLGPDAIAEFERYAVAQSNLGGHVGNTQRAISAASEMQSGGKVSDADRRLVHQAGLDDSIRGSRNALGSASARNTVEAGRQAEHTLESGYDALASSTDKLTGSFENLNAALGNLPFTENPLGVIGGTSALASGPVGGVLGALGGIPGAAWLGQTLGVGRGGRGGGGAGAGGTGGGGGGGGPVQDVFVTNWPEGGVGGGGGGFGGALGGGLLGRLLGGGGGAGGGLGRLAGLGRVGGLAAAGAGVAWAGKHAFDLLGDSTWNRDERVQNPRKEGWGALRFWERDTIEDPGKHMGSPVPKRDRGRDPQGQPRMPEMPFFSLNDPTPGGSSSFGYARARGGIVPGNHNRDDVDIKATPGEVVVPKHRVSAYGGPEKLMALLGFLETAGGRNGHYREGGVVEGSGNKHQPAAPPSAGSVTGDTEGLHPEFYRRLKAWSAFVGQPYKVGSGMRTMEEQARLYDRWQRRVPGQAPAAKPGSSNHNFGLASDGPHWRGKNPEKFGLRYPMSYEPWHVEPDGAKGMRNGVVPAIDLSSSPTAAQASGAAIPPASNLVQANIPGIGANETSIMSRLLSSVGLNSGGSVQHWARRAAAPTATDAAGAAVTAPAPQAAGAPTNPTGNAAIGKAMAAQRGWTGAEWDALHALWQGESGWKHTADNPGSSAYGIPQAMIAMHKMPTGYYDKKTGSGASTQGHGGDPGVQIGWGLDYIAGRYKTPSKAYATWKSRNPHWYEKGAWDVPEDGHHSILHRGEMVVPEPHATRMRQAVKRRGAQNAMPSTPVTSQGSGGRASVVVHLTAPITLAGRATNEDAAHFVSMVTSQMEENDVLAHLGSGS